MCDFQFGEHEFGTKCDFGHLPSINQVFKFKIAYHLIVEFYSSGNIILTDHEYKIMALLRTVDVTSTTDSSTTTSTTAADNNADTTKTSKDATFRVGEKYAFGLVKPFEGVSADGLKDAFSKAVSAAAEIQPAVVQNNADSSSTTEQTSSTTPLPSSKNAKSSKKYSKAKKDSAATSKNPKQMEIRRWIREVYATIYGPSLVDHVFAFSGIDSNLTLGALVDSADLFTSTLLSLTKGFQDADRIAYSIFRDGTPCGGWITQTEHKVSLSALFIQRHP
jgi:hypothetical protein